ncbi:MAG: hypothetical protein U0Q18_16515 [Bryobacteraceae bacterium]
MRIFSYLFHGLLALFLLALSMAALTSGQSLHLNMLPWKGGTLTYILLIGALIGLLSVLLAIRRTWRGLFFLWSVLVLLMIVRGFFLSPYAFRGRSEFHQALWLTAAAIIATFGAWFQARRAPVK